MFGGLLWPIAWLWAYTRPVGYRMAYGTDKHEDYFDEMADKARAGELLREELAHLREELDAMAARRARCRRRSRSLRAELDALQRRAAASGRRAPRAGGEALMEAILLGIYSFFVWLIFIKLKWLPWNTTSQVTVAIIPIVGLTALILMLNVVAPSSADVRVYQVHGADRLAGEGARARGAGRGRQPAGEEGRRAVPDRSEPYQLRSTAESAARRRRGEQRELERAWRMQRRARASCASTRRPARMSRGCSAKLELARTRVAQNRELVATGAGSKFDLEQAETNLSELEGQLPTARARSAGPQAVRPGDGEQASVQQLGAKVERRIRAGGADPRAARERALGARADRRPCRPATAT